MGDLVPDIVDRVDVDGLGNSWADHASFLFDPVAMGVGASRFVLG